LHQLFERSTAFFIILKLIEARAGRGKQHGITSAGVAARISYGVCQSAAVHNGNR
jgi:hypothetical protein